jgi:hypothetical protein
MQNDSSTQFNRVTLFLHVINVVVETGKCLDLNNSKTAVISSSAQAKEFHLKERSSLPSFKYSFTKPCYGLSPPG